VIVLKLWRAALWRFWRSPLNRLTCYLWLAIFGVYVLVNGLTLLVLSRLEDSANAEIINSEIEGLDQIYGDEDIPGLAHAIAQRVRYPRDPRAVYALVAANGEILAGHFSSLPASAIKPGWVKFAQSGATPRRHIIAFAQALEENEVLIAGRDISEQAQLVRRSWELSGIALLVLAFAATVFMFLFRNAITKSLLEPLTIVDRFSQGDLRQSISSNGSGDSFDLLGEMLNRMMRRIEDLIGGIVRSTDAIAHDLRTPLSRLHNQLAQLRDQAQTPEAMAHTDAAIREAEQLIQRFSALLRLSKLDAELSGDHAAEMRANHSTIDLAEVAQDALELWQAVAEQNTQTLSLQIANPGLHFHMQGDRDQLFQLLSNLLDNAIKYTPQQGEIKLILNRVQGALHLSVQDNGPGVASADHEKMFDRFVRLETERATPGFGLGLSLVRAIAQAHGAQIVVKDAEPGLCITLIFRALDASVAA
jgi:signal transduction histidine kinase